MTAAADIPVLEGRRLRLKVRGLVQGVGFRPFAHALAERLSLSGFVRNNSDGVLIEIEGAWPEAFVEELRKTPPPLARIDAVDIDNLDPIGGSSFAIQPSLEGSGHARIGPDVAICEDCLDDLFDARSRFHLYPLVTCTNCGPRLTLAKSLPYDRARTSMAPFPLCAACAHDYADPRDRRFHAEPIGCRACGPNIDMGLSEIAACLMAGQILAIKGLGGFHLVCDANNPRAVETLRQRKRRDEKPFAVMVANLASAARVANIDEPASLLLQSPARPIVLVPSRGTLPPRIAPGLSQIGLMLAYTPLHWLIIHALLGAPAPFDRAAANDIALVMTSANVAGEPLVTDDDEARARLADVADTVVSHGRAIVVRADDSVMRTVDGAPAFIRRARGFVPEPIDLGADGPSVLAAGGDLKNTFVLTRGREAFLSQHIGDLDDRETLRFRQEALTHLQGLLGVKPVLVACDLHPNFVSRRQAERSGLPLVPVQHHVAHVAAVIAEHKLRGPVLGVALDGHGFGVDGTAWGGEIIRVEDATWSREGSLRPLPLPGGDRAAREPWRMGLAALVILGFDADLIQRFLAVPQASALVKTLRGAPRMPQTSSLGRLFDAAAAIGRVRMFQNYEGQAAMELESLVSDPRAVPEGWRVEEGRLDLLPLLGHLFEARASAVEVANLFHGTLIAALADWIGAAATRLRLSRIALGGGCLMNRVLTEGLVADLRARGLQPFIPRAAPCNDGGLALGQAAFALAQMRYEAFGKDI